MRGTAVRFTGDYRGFYPLVENCEDDHVLSTFLLVIVTELLLISLNYQTGFLVKSLRKLAYNGNTMSFKFWSRTSLKVR